jgi:homoserine kinase
MQKDIKAFAPASIGNIGIGFDIMGLCIERPGDEIIARLSDKPGLRIAAIHGGDALPLDPAKNTASVAVAHLLEHVGQTGRGIELEIFKKMPSGSGLGSSAASAVAAVVAVNTLLECGMRKRDLLRFACLGEQVASGGFHADNVAPSLLGGIVLIRDNDSLDVHHLPAPEELFVAVVHPHVELLTKHAREILKPDIPLKTHIRQSANVASFVAALFNSDYTLLGRSLTDHVIEPQRASLIPGFYAVKTAAMEANALGCSISGAGPSIFALFKGVTDAENAGIAMQKAFETAGVQSTIYLSPVNRHGAVVI